MWEGVVAEHPRTPQLDGGVLTIGHLSPVPPIVCVLPRLIWKLWLNLLTSDEGYALLSIPQHGEDSVCPSMSSPAYFLR